MAKSKSGTRHHPYTVPALDALIGDPDILRPTKDVEKVADHLYIPMQYVDRLGRFYNEPGQSTRKDSAQQLLATISKMMVCINSTESPFYICENGMKVEFREALEGSNSSKAYTIALAQQLKQENINTHNEVSILTGDNYMIAKAAAAKLNITHVNPNVYTGFRKVHLSDEYVSLWTRGQKQITAKKWAEIFGKSQPPLRANEFVILTYNNPGQTQQRFENIGRFDVDAGQNGALVHLKYAKFDQPNYGRIIPKTPLQAMYLEALMAPPEKIPVVVIGSLFGTGKTFLPIAAGLYGVGYNVSKFMDFEPRYRRIFVCPRDGALGKDIGYLPGSATEKTMAKALPIVDMVEEILDIIRDAPTEMDYYEVMDLDGRTMPIVPQPDMAGRKGKGSHKKERKQQRKVQSGQKSVKNEVRQVLENYFEFQPLINMGGRSILDSLMFYDESQDFELYQIRELVTRFGNGSKVVFAGDPTQLSNPHLNYSSNGLSYVASKLADSPYAAVIFDHNEEQIVRHWALREIAKAFGTHC